MPQKTPDVQRKTQQPAQKSGPRVQGVPQGVPINVVQRDAAEKTGRQAQQGEQAGSSTADPDLEEMARKLLDPLRRLLRAELRQGRERFGHPYDRRR